MTAPFEIEPYPGSDDPNVTVDDEMITFLVSLNRGSPRERQLVTHLAEHLQQAWAEIRRLQLLIGRT